MNISQFFITYRFFIGGVAVVVGIVLGVVTTQVLRRHLKQKQRESATASDSTPVPVSWSTRTSTTTFQSATKPSIEEPSNVQSKSPPNIPPPLVTTLWPKAPVSGNDFSSDWAEFVRDRLDNLDPTSCSNETKWALGIVDFLDELAEADTKASSAERDSSASLRNSLLSCLAEKGFAIEDSDEWNPDKQRAVSVVRKPHATCTKILGKGSTGLSRDGKIIRKQEVKIEMKGN